MINVSMLPSANSSSTLWAAYLMYVHQSSLPYTSYSCIQPFLSTYPFIYVMRFYFRIITDLLAVLVQIPHHEPVNEVSVVKDGVFLYKFVPRAVSVMTTNRYA